MYFNVWYKISMLSCRNECALMKEIIKVPQFWKKQDSRNLFRKHAGSTHGCFLRASFCCLINGSQCIKMYMLIRNFMLHTIHASSLLDLKKWQPWKPFCTNFSSSLKGNLSSIILLEVCMYSLWEIKPSIWKILPIHTCVFVIIKRIKPLIFLSSIF